MGNAESYEQETTLVGYRVLGVQPNSPASSVGLVSFFDFVVAANNVPLKVLDSTFVDMIRGSEDKPLPCAKDGLISAVSDISDSHSPSEPDPRPPDQLVLLSVPAPSSGEFSKRSASTSTNSSWRLHTFASWRPNGLAGVGTRSARKHADPKQVAHGIEGLLSIAGVAG